MNARYSQLPDKSVCAAIELEMRKQKALDPQFEDDFWEASHECAKRLEAFKEISPDEVMQLARWSLEAAKNGDLGKYEREDDITLRVRSLAERVIRDLLLSLEGDPKR